jgi:murein DD-endopeptidase MepM/ murein hydrolase activator NlpD
MRRGLTAILVLLALPGPAAAYPWPLAPFDRPHPVRANFGDPRTVFYNQLPDSLDGPGRFAFHDGIDISAPAGTPVYPVTDGVSRYVSATAIAVRHGRTDFRYMHILPVVEQGQHVHAQRTVLGYVEQWAGHLHFGEIDHGHAVNPLVRGHIAPYFDRTTPSVTEVSLRRADGRTLQAPFVVCGTVAILATAQDLPAVPVPPPWEGLPVAPARISWSLEATGNPLIVRGRVAIDFTKGLPSNTRFWDVYSRGTFQNAPRFGHAQYPGLHGRFLYVVVRALDTERLPDGTYTLTVFAEDTRGNQGRTSTAVTVDNASGCTA